MSHKLKIILVLLMVYTHAYADELVQEISMKTSVGEVVLGNENCKVVNEHGFEFSAYATENGYRHEGCWFKDHDIVNIWFYEENPALVATYKDYYFSPRTPVISK